MSKTATKTLLLTTTTLLQRPYEELGMVTSHPAAGYYGLAEKRLRKNALRQFPDADAIIGVTVRRFWIAFVLFGTAVRYV